MTQFTPYTAQQPQPKKKKVPTWVWALVISALVILLIVILASAVARRSDSQNPGALPVSGEDYLAVLYVEGTMVSESSSSGFSGESYDQEYLLTTLANLTEDSRNRALLLYIDSPGGEVMAATELAEAVAAYQEATGRPVYAYGHSNAASGGYWLAATADRFFVNRYCLTGSIGVIMGPVFDFSGLMENYGVRAKNITSGAQKSMGSNWEEMTPETEAILQSIVDEYYDYFLDWVSQQRGMDRDELKTLADGRVYTALQAVENGLADQVGDYEDCLNALLELAGEDLAVVKFRPEADMNWWGFFSQSSAERELGSLLKLMPPSGVLAYSYYGN